MIQKLNDEIKQAMRDKAKARLQTLRSMMNDLKNAGIEKKGNKGLTEEVASPAEYLEEPEMVKILQSAAKRRRESIEQYVEGGRPELAEKEEEELKILAEFLPKALSEEDLRALVAEAIAAVGAGSMADMGKVMKEAQPKIAGRADGKAVSSMVKELLS
ncbi:MAG: GatB/YqeY domain-containing protein [Planctomycetota bacterium]